MNVQLNENLRYLRNRKELSQEEVSKLLGINRSTYAHYETGRRQPDPEMIKKFADFYNVSTDYLLGHNFNNEDSKKYSKEEIQYARDFTEKLGYMGSHGIDLSDFTDEQLVEFVYELEDYAKYLKLKNK